MFNLLSVFSILNPSPIILYLQSFIHNLLSSISLNFYPLSLILHPYRLIVLVILHPFSELLDDSVIWVNLQLLLGGHIPHSAAISQCLSFHDTLHVRRPAIFGCYDTARTAHQTVAHLHLYLKGRFKVWG